MLILLSISAGCNTASNDGSDGKTLQPSDTVENSILIQLSPDATLAEIELLNAIELYELGVEAFEIGELGLARAYLDRLITVEGNNAEAYYLRGEIYAALGILD
ncbi:MAG: hypothetical protein N2C13_02760, partial [Chloroflexota bacterium]